MTDSPLQNDLARLAERRALAVPPLERRTGPVANRSGKRLSPALEEAAAAALAAYRASPEHAALVADLPGLGLDELQARLKEALEGPHFAAMLERLRRPADEDPDDFLPKAVSLGVMGQVVLILGLSGSVGYVMDISITNSNPGVYVGGAFDVGIDAGLQAEVCLGLWRESTDDLAGVYVGEEVDVDDGTGLTEATFLNDDELGLMLVGIDLGLDDGMENTDFYFFEFGLDREPTYQPGEATYLVQLGTLSCENSKDNYDTVYFEFLQDGESTVYRYPAWDGYQMCESQENDTYSSWDVGLIIKFNSSFTLRLHIGDEVMDDVTFPISGFSGLNQVRYYTFDTTVGAFDEVKYELAFSLIRN